MQTGGFSIRRSVHRINDSAMLEVLRRSGISTEGLFIASDAPKEGSTRRCSWLSFATSGNLKEGHLGTRVNYQHLDDEVVLICLEK